MDANNRNFPWQESWLSPLRRWLASMLGLHHFLPKAYKYVYLGKLPACTYTWDYHNNTLQFDKKLLIIFGLSKRDLAFIQQKNWLEMISAIDRPIIVKKAQKCVLGESSFFHCRVTAFRTDKTPLCIILHGRADRQQKKIQGSLTLLHPDFIY